MNNFLSNLSRRKFWVRSAKWRQSRVRTSPARQFFLSPKPDDNFVNFPTADFHQIWPQNTWIYVPLKCIERGVLKFSVYARKTHNLRVWTGTLLWPAYSPEDALQRDIVHSALLQPQRNAVALRHTSLSVSQHQSKARGVSYLCQLVVRCTALREMPAYRHIHNATTGYVPIWSNEGATCHSVQVSAIIHVRITLLCSPPALCVIRPDHSVRPDSTHRPTRYDHSLKLNSTQLPVELSWVGPVRRCDQGFTRGPSVCHRSVPCTTYNVNSLTFILRPELIHVKSN